MQTALIDARETVQTEENKSAFSAFELLVKFQPSRIVHAREEDWEPNWRTVTTPKPGFGPILLDAVVLDCLVTILACFPLSPLALRSELEKNAYANARASLCQSGT